MKRIVLFVATNLGVQNVMTADGTRLDLGALLTFSAVVGFTGSFISLLMSKWIAKMSTRAHVIDTPRNAAESWLVNTVHRLADQAGIGHPEVAIYDSADVNAFAT